MPGIRTMISRSLGFKLVIAAMVLGLVTIGLGGLAVYKVSEDAIKRDSQRSARQLALELAAVRMTGKTGTQALADILTSQKVEDFGAAWIMDSNGFLIAHMDPKFRNMVEAQTYIGDTVVNLNVVERPVQQLGEKNIVHRAKLQELIEKFDGGFGTYNFLGDNKIVAFRVVKENGWLVAVDQPISTAFSELSRIKKVVVMTCAVIAVLVFAFTWFAVRIIIRPYYREQEESSLRLGALNRELEASRQKQEKAGNSLNRLFDLSVAMQCTGVPESHLPLLLGAVQERFNVDRIVLLLPEEDGKVLRCRSSVGNVYESEEKIQVPVSGEGGALAQAFLSKRTVYFDGSGPVPRELSLRPPYDRIRSLRTKAFAIFPLVARDRVVGVLGVDNKMSRRPLNREDVENMENFSYKVASLLDNAMNCQSMRRAMEELENRDSLTGLFHLRYARPIAEGHMNSAMRDRVPFSMTYVHLSNFKEYNDLNGSRKGDFVLQRTSGLLKGQESQGAIPVRCYGATFLVLLPGKNREQGTIAAGRFLEDFGRVSFQGEERLPGGKLTARVVTAEFSRETGKSFDEFFSGIQAL